jgi:flagellar hook assembly protein FlgD
MQRSLICIGLTVLLAASLAMAKDKKGPLTGTWDGQAHGGSLGEMAFTLSLQQDKETVSGSISTPYGVTPISSGTFKRNTLEFHLDTAQGTYIVSGKFHKGTLSGTWSKDNEKGTWESKKHVAAPK